MPHPRVRLPRLSAHHVTRQEHPDPSPVVPTRPVLRCWGWETQFPPEGFGPCPSTYGQTLYTDGLLTPTHVSGDGVVSSLQTHPPVPGSHTPMVLREGSVYDQVLLYQSTLRRFLRLQTVKQVHRDLGTPVGESLVGSPYSFGWTPSVTPGLPGGYRYLGGNP